ncbi:MAG TPA: glycosyltransferase [Chitinophagales bacterium]|nr:glycosyltransferase [Chitinophagales bacterium]
MNSKGKSIIFFSLHYPFHISDSYLDKEIDLLSQSFEKVIVITNNTFSEERRPTPPNAVVYRFTPFEKRSSFVSLLLLVFKPMFCQEIFRLFFVYKQKISFGLLKEVLAFYSRSITTKRFLQQVILEQNIDTNNLLIYSYWMIESSFASALLKQQHSQVKTITRAHSLDVYFDRSPVKYHPFRQFIFSQMDKIYFISANARDYFARAHHFDTDKMQKTAISRIGIESPTNFIEQRTDETLRIISVGYIQKLKRIDLIVDTLALMGDAKIEWVHVGHSNHNEADFIEVQKYAANKLGGKSNISYRFTGKTSKEDLFNLYAERPFDLHLNVSETEGIPVSMMEAMSYSVPLIGTNVGGVAEIVEHGVNGFLLSPYPDSAEVKIAIEKFNALPVAQKNVLRKNAFCTWNAKYNAQVNNQNFVNDVMALVG